VFDACTQACALALASSEWRRRLLRHMMATSHTAHRPSVRPSVRRSIGRSVRPSVVHSRSLVRRSSFVVRSSFVFRLSFVHSLVRWLVGWFVGTRLRHTGWSHRLFEATAAARSPADLAAAITSRRDLPAPRDTSSRTRLFRALALPLALALARTRARP